MNTNPLRDFIRALECAESAFTVEMWINGLSVEEKKSLAPCLSVVANSLAYDA